MEIRINICDINNTTIIKNANTIDEVKEIIRNEIEKFGMTVFNYCWKADGRSLMVYDDEDVVDECNDVNEIVEMMGERTEKFGVAMVWSIVFDEAKGYGTQYEVYVFDMENETYNKSVGIVETDIEDGLNAVKEFLNEGNECGTVVEAVYWAIKAALNGEANTIYDAINIGESEWYK